MIAPGLTIDEAMTVIAACMTAQHADPEGAGNDAVLYEGMQKLRRAVVEGEADNPGLLDDFERRFNMHKRFAE